MTIVVTEDGVSSPASPSSYLGIVNAVLRRLRENECTSVQDTSYSKLIGEFVNETKREVEDAYHWKSLYSSVTLTAVAGTSTYTLSGTSNRTKIPELEQYNTTDKTYMIPVTMQYINKMNSLGQQPNGTPYNFAVNGVDDLTGELTVKVFPTPATSGAEMVFNLFNPQADLADDADVMKVARHPVIDGAWARAISERGEDGGRMADAQFGIYKSTLADAVAIAAERDGGINWEPN